MKIIDVIITNSGDLTIQYDSTRLFATFFIFAIVLIYAVTFNNIMDQWLQGLGDGDRRYVNMPYSRCNIVISFYIQI